jgi:sulfur-oxidizing protein SoxX
MMRIKIAAGQGRWMAGIRVPALCAAALLSSVSPPGATADDPARGKTLAMDRGKGNCLACHAFDGGQLPGNIGPPLLAMQSRYPDKNALFRQIWDPTENNPDSRMPPFGKHGILTDEEITLIVEYLLTL